LSRSRTRQQSSLQHPRAHHLCQPFRFADARLCAAIPAVLAGTQSRLSLQPDYDEYLSCAASAFGAGSFPTMTEETPLDDFYRELLIWMETHNFFSPAPGIVVSIGRPDWNTLFAQLATESDVVPHSNLPFNIQSSGGGYIRDIHLLYTGARPPLRAIRSWCERNNTALFAKGG
jgi:hypothetical protein